MKFGPDVRVPDTKCPACKASLTGASGLDHTAIPKKGDVSICTNCGEFLLYGEGLSVERLPFRVEMELKPDQLRNLYELRRIARRRQLQLKAQLEALEMVGSPPTHIHPPGPCVCCKQEHKNVKAKNGDRWCRQCQKDGCPMPIIED